MIEISKENSMAIAKNSKVNTELFNLDGAVGEIHSSSGARVVVLPTKVHPFRDITGLAKGAVIGAICIDHAPPSSNLGTGLYSIKVLKDNGTWVAQFIKDDMIVVSTTKVKVDQMMATISQPQTFVYNFSPFLLGFAVGFGAGAVGFMVGIGVGYYLWHQ